MPPRAAWHHWLARSQTLATPALTGALVRIVTTPTGRYPEHPRTREAIAQVTLEIVARLESTAADFHHRLTLTDPSPAEDCTEMAWPMPKLGCTP